MKSEGKFSFNFSNEFSHKSPSFLTLKLVEIIGEDEAHNLDPETIYFITHLLNQNDLKNIRNEILISALPQRS